MIYFQFAIHLLQTCNQLLILQSLITKYWHHLYYRTILYLIQSTVNLETFGDYIFGRKNQDQSFHLVRKSLPLILTISTLPKTNSWHLKIDLPERKIYLFNSAFIWTTKNSDQTAGWSPQMEFCKGISPKKCLQKFRFRIFFRTFHTLPRKPTKLLLRKNPWNMSRVFPPHGGFSTNQPVATNR